MHTLENEFLEMIQGYVPQHWVMELLKNYVIYRNRHLSDFVPAGLSDGNLRDDARLPGHSSRGREFLQPPAELSRRARRFLHDD